MEKNFQNRYFGIFPLVWSRTKSITFGIDSERSKTYFKTQILRSKKISHYDFSPGTQLFLLEQWGSQVEIAPNICALTTDQLRDLLKTVSISFPQYSKIQLTLVRPKQSIHLETIMYLKRNTSELISKILISYTILRKAGLVEKFQIMSLFNI